ncbi:MAG: EamA family transporter [Chloroflexi bacterium]|nr:EamA family transporter [Chloroflexota bacterium]MCI0773483.1 EamA family transporter [Chloroflexota bacterium]
MKLQNSLLYALTSLIWGSTWFAITFQLGTVDPEISVVYRFTLASAILFAYCFIRRLPMRFTLREHGFIALQGLTLFSVSYVLVYLAELHLTSGYVAIVFSLTVVLNVFFGAVFLRDPIRPRVLSGAAIGIVGLVLVFLPALGKLSLSGGQGLGLTLALAGSIIASLGNIISARNQRRKIPVVQANAYGMGYGALMTLVIALVRGSKVSFDANPEYVLSLLYLAIFGTVIAFGSYLTILGRMGPDRAGYIAVVFPIVALFFSTLFEGLTWELLTILGVGLVVAGNVLALARTWRVHPEEAPSAA